MSLILDALNKSRNEAEEVPGLGAEHYREEPPKPWLSYLPWAGLAAAVFFVIWLIASGGAEPEGNVVTPVAELSRNLGSAATSVTDQLKARADEGRETRVAQAQAQAAAPPAPASTPVPTLTPAAEQAVAEQSPAAKDATAADNAAVKALYEKRKRAGQELLERAARAKAAEAQAEPAKAAPQSVVASPSLEEPVDVEEVLRQAQQEVANASLVEHPAPFLVDLSQQTKNDIPTILYQRHEYSSQAGSSSVTINGKAVRVGGTPAAGLQVDDILVDSVILSYRGTQFRLRALNSWVNL